MWVVVGAGISGVGACRLLRFLHEDFLFFDDKPLKEPTKSEFEKKNITVIHDPTDSRLITPKTKLILSPGVPLSHPLVVQAKSKHCAVVSEIEFALAYFKGTVISVTGTNGKSTTVAMAAHALKKEGYAAEAAGNIGVSLSEVLAQAQHPEVIVLELSSYQIEHSSNIVSKVAIFTNFSHDHLGRHKTLREYFETKWKLLTWVPKGCSVILSKEVAALAKSYGHELASLKADKYLVDSNHLNPILERYTTGISGKHNFINGTMALMACGLAMGLNDNSLAKNLNDYQPLPYRFAKIGSFAGFSVINDSKSTNVDATIMALESTDQPVVLFLGGLGKEESFKPILAFSDKILFVVAFGKSLNEIVTDLDGQVSVTSFKNLRQALQGLPSFIESIRGKGAILFSPACASLDEFSNFEERGLFFTQALTPYLDSH